MAMQISLERFGVILLNSLQVRTAPGSMPHTDAYNAIIFSGTVTENQETPIRPAAYKTEESDQEETYTSKSKPHYKEPPKRKYRSSRIR